MKNHLGTFINAGTDANPSATGLHTLNAIFEINKHPAILGGNPVRQQLCIVDSLLANGGGAGGSFDTRCDRIVMGTFAPTVDYCTATKIMTDVMNKPDKNNNLPKFLTTFGYAATEVLDWNEYVPGSAPPINPSKDGGAGGTGSGGNSGTGGTGSGGNSGAGGTGSGGNSGAGGAGSGGNSGAGGAGRGGTSATGGAGSGGASASGGMGSGGTSATGGASSGGASATGGAGSGGAVGMGGTSSNGGSIAGASGGAVGTSSGLGGSMSTGAKGASGGCNVALGGRGAARWETMLAIGALVAGKLRGLVARQRPPSDEQPVEAGIDEAQNKSSK
jgi:hypothetical protein